MLRQADVQVVDGNRLIMTPYDLSFRKDKVDAKLCTKKLTKPEIMQFRKVCSLLALQISLGSTSAQVEASLGHAV